MLKPGIKRTLFNAAVPAAGTSTVLLSTGADSTIALLVAGLRTMIAQAKFVYGSAGTSVDAYLQTSLDGGVTWIDVMNFHFLTTTATKVSKIVDTVALAAATAPGDGALTANTIVDGLLGDQWRLKLVVVGNYAGSTLRVDIDGKV